MNNDPSSVISFVICLILSIYWTYCFIAGSLGKSTNNITISDNFDIGYIRKSQPVEVCLDDSRIKELELKVKQLTSQLKQKQPTVTQKPVVKQQPKLSKPVNTVKVQELKKQQPQCNPLLNECTAALVALGYKDKAAKEQATSFLGKNNVKSVEEFIIKFFRK